MKSRNTIVFLSIEASKLFRNLCDIPQCQNMTQGRSMVWAAHESRLKCGRCKNYWPRRHSPVGRLRHQAINSILPKQTKTWDDGPLRSRCHSTPLQARLANLHEWVRVSFGAPFIWPCATSKKKNLVNYRSIQTSARHECQAADRKGVRYELFLYLSYVPPTEQVWHKAFLKTCPGAGSKPTHSRQLQKCLDSHRHSLKNRHLRRLAITPTLPEKVRDWGTASWGSRMSVSAARRECLSFFGTRVRQPQPTATKSRYIQPGPHTGEYGQPKCVPV